MAAKKKPFTPQNLKGVLVFILLLIVVGGGGIFYYGLSITRDFSDEVNQSLKAADASSVSLQQLSLLKSRLSDSEAIKTKADSLFASPSSYQSIAEKDINHYASLANIAIDSIDFDSSSVPGTYFAIVKLSSPVNYNKLVQFLALTEDNLPKMQVTSIDISHSSSAGSVQVGEIKIKVSVK